MPSPNPKISVIVPVYNTEKYLRRCIDSILAQTFTDFELLLINDGSRDSSGAICDEYAAKDSRVRVFHKENGGVSSARNVGLDNAKGEWISFVDSDDWIEAKAYECMLHEVEYKGVQLALCGFNEILRDEIHPIFLPNIQHGKDSFIQEYLLCEWYVIWNLLVKRELIENEKFRLDETVRIGEDADLLFKLLLSTSEIIIINKQLYNYDRTNELSALHNMHFYDYENVVKVILNMIEYFKYKGVFNKYEQEFAWKILRAKQDLVLYPDMHNTFLGIYPASHKFILTCPTLREKMKCMMWLLTHHLGFITKMINHARFLLIGNKDKY